jgi:hypothetical protein
MNREEVDAFLAEADDVIDDWEGSIDAASWSGDGSHETEISGESYYDDARCNCWGCQLLTSSRMSAQLVEWQRGLIQGITQRMLQPRWLDQLIFSAETTSIELQVDGRWQRLNGARADRFILDEWTTGTTPAGPARALAPEPEVPSSELAPIMDSAWAVTVPDAGDPVIPAEVWDRCLPNEGQRPMPDPSIGQLVYASPRRRDALLAAVLRDVEREEARGRTAQESPYGPGRRR